NPGPGIAVIRSLKEDGRLNLRTIGLAYDAMEPGIYLDWLVERSFIMPYPSSEEADYLGRLFYIQEVAGLDVVIPTLDAELPLYIKGKEKLLSRGIKTFLPTWEQFELRSKEHLPEVAERIGLAIPPTEAVTSPSELYRALDRVGFPAMIKGLFYKAYRVHTYQEAESSFQKIVAEWGYPVLVQKVVQGEEINVIGLGDGQGSSLGLMAIKKLWITAWGKIWTGVTIKNESIIKAAEAFLKAYGWRGAFELECIATEDKIYLIEINPRFPAWVYFATGAGLNLPARLLRAAVGLPVERDSHYEAGRLYIRYTYDLVTDMETFQRIITRGES
ncbi:MAG TPA: ATP-grasp domain-containing protein, partial [Thermodesulfatator sp.]|nr:ATP-grasp domain-containing protein [Thermodesulfatator sp.]